MSPVLNNHGINCLHDCSNWMSTSRYIDFVDAYSAVPLLFPVQAINSRTIPGDLIDTGGLNFFYLNFFYLHAHWIAFHVSLTYQFHSFALNAYTLRQRPLCPESGRICHYSGLHPVVGRDSSSSATFSVGRDGPPSLLCNSAFSNESNGCTKRKSNLGGIVDREIIAWKYRSGVCSRFQALEADGRAETRLAASPDEENSLYLKELSRAFL